MNNKILGIIIKAEDQASKVMANVSDKMQGYSQKIATVAKTATFAIGAAAVAAGGFAISSAADYEQSLNIFKSVSSATSEQMTQVAAKARELGNDMSLPGVSAKDAAAAMVELSKAGLNVNDTLAASKGVLSLAKAGQLDTAQAAEIAANALNAFSLDGKQASRIADLLAAAANASSAGVTDMALALQMSSASAASVKVPIQDLTTMIAEMANNGIKGSDAGTSLKTMFMNLIPTTDKAKESMNALNLDFYDAQGNFVGTRKMIEQLQEGTKNLTDEQKALHIENIFGADSSRAVNILLKEGVKGYDDLSKAVNKQGAAADLAAAQNAGFNGAIDSLKSSLETVAIDVGMKMLPFLTDMAKTMSAKVQPAFEKLTKVGEKVGKFLGPAIEGLADSIMHDLLPAIKDIVTSDFAKIVGGAFAVAAYAAMRAIEGLVRIASSFVSQMSQATPVLVGLAASIVAYTVVTNAMTVGTKALAVAQLALNTAMKANPFVLLASVAVGIVAAYASVVTQADRNTDAHYRLKAAQDAMAASADAAKAAQDRLHGALLDQEGASLRVETAQRAYNDAVEQYGPKSLEARNAAYDLKRATDDLEKANANVRDRTNEVTKAEEEKQKKANEFIKVNDAIKDSANRAASSYNGWADAISKARAEDAKLGKNSLSANSNTFKAMFPTSPFGTRASGGSVRSGQPYLVGENKDGSLNPTSELFVPRQSGTIVNSSDLQKVLGNSGGGGQTFNMYGDVILGDSSAVDRYFDRIGAQKELGSYGVGV